MMMMIGGSISLSVGVMLLVVVVGVYAAVQPYQPQTINRNCCGVKTTTTGYVDEMEPNNNMSQAMNLECQYWVQSRLNTGTPDIEASGVGGVKQNSPKFSWITVMATGDDSEDWYSFSIPRFFSNVTLRNYQFPSGFWTFYIDIDYADKSDGRGFDAFIDIFRGTTPLKEDEYSRNDDNACTRTGIAYCEKSQGSNVNVTAKQDNNTYIIHLDSFQGWNTESVQGTTYYVKVSRNTGARSQTEDKYTGPIPSGVTYRFTVSMAYHSWNNTAAGFPNPTQKPPSDCPSSSSSSSSFNPILTSPYSDDDEDDNKPRQPITI